MAPAQQDWTSQILQTAPKYGLDPQAALSVARTEGLSGLAGDGNTSWGPFQLHVGGALPAGRDQAWAESPAGIDYALRTMANAGARGLHGQAAINAIVQNFERPANPSAEMAKAWGYYGQGGQTQMSSFGGSPSNALVGDRRQLLASLLGVDPSSLPQTTIAPTNSHFKPGIPGSEGAAVQGAMTQLGVPYKWGGTSWGKALDCSGLVQQAFARSGVKIGRTTYTQWKQGQAVDPRQIQPGDVVFFDMGKNGPNHEGLYVGHGRFIEAPHTGATVRISDLNGRTGFVGARRFT